MCDTVDFDVYAIQNNTVTVSFRKVDGTMREITGKLFPDGQYSMVNLAEIDAWDSVRLWTDEGWKSFKKCNLVSFIVNAK
jgi:hypothetical protein